MVLITMQRRRWSLEFDLVHVEPGQSKRHAEEAQQRAVDAVIDRLGGLSRLDENFVQVKRPELLAFRDDARDIEMRTWMRGAGRVSRRTHVGRTLCFFTAFGNGALTFDEAEALVRRLYEHVRCALGYDVEARVVLHCLTGVF